MEKVVSGSAIKATAVVSALVVLCLSINSCARNQQPPMMRPITRFGDVRRQDREVRLAQLAALLQGHEVARVPTICKGIVPDELLAQVPPVTSDTPPLPRLPRQVSERGLRPVATIRGGSLAAVVYAHSFQSKPCILVMETTSNGTPATYKHVLQYECQIAEAHLWVTDKGRGLVVWYRYTTPANSESLVTRIYVLHYPTWEPEAVVTVDGEPLPEPLWPLSHTIDASVIYFRTRNALFQLRPKEAYLSQIGTIKLPSVPLYAIAAPDLRFLAISFRFPLFVSPKGIRTRLPLWIYDTQQKKSYTIVTRPKGQLLARALAWSRKLPHTLFFLELDDTVWQLDVDLAVQTVDSVGH